MKRHQASLLSLMTALATLNACANPAAAVRDEAQVFVEKYPNHLVRMNVGARQLQYAWSGDSTKRPLLFVHGSPGSWEGWAHFLLDENLRAQFQLIAVDRPGYGGSNPGESERSVQSQVELIRQSLQTNTSGLPAILVGHSYGGPVVADLAMRYPELVAGVIFVAVSVDPNLEKTKWYQYPAGWWPIRLLIPGPLRVCNEEIFALKGQLFALVPKWKMLKAKVISIQGTNDDLVPPENQDFLLKMIGPNQMVRADRVPGLNHFIPWKRSDLILGAIVEMKTILDQGL